MYFVLYCYLYSFRVCYCLVYSILVFINIVNCSCNCFFVVVKIIFALYNRNCKVSIVCSMSFIACIVLCAVFYLSVVCYFV
jgi:hypothetical protein